MIQELQEGRGALQWSEDLLERRMHEDKGVNIEGRNIDPVQGHRARGCLAADACGRLRMSRVYEGEVRSGWVGGSWVGQILK